MSRAHALYRFWDASGALLYVGITHHPGQRWRAHKQRDWWLDVAAITIEPHADREAVLRAERAAIVAEQPRHNVVHNRATTVTRGRRAARPASLQDARDIEPPLTRAEIRRIERALTTPGHWGPVL